MWWVTADSAVGPLVVVAVQEVWQGCDALAIGVVDAGVGPFACEGAVEAFDLAVLPWAVRSDELVFCSQVVDDSSDGVAVLVAPVCSDTALCGIIHFFGTDLKFNKSVSACANSRVQ